MNKLIFTIAVSALIALATQARADVGTVTLLSGTLTNNSTWTINSTAKVDDNEIVGVQAVATGNQAGTGNITLTFARSGDGVEFETTPRFTWVFALNGTTKVVAYTNLTTTVGAAHSIRLVSVANADASCSATNATILLIKKRVDVK